MIATLRTSRLLPALLAVTLLLGAGLPLVHYACAMSGQTMAMSPLGASPLGTSALSSSEHDQETHAPAAAMDKLCEGISDACAQPLPECSEARTQSVGEAPVPPPARCAHSSAASAVGSFASRVSYYVYGRVRPPRAERPGGRIVSARAAPASLCGAALVAAAGSGMLPVRTVFLRGFR